MLAVISILLDEITADLSAGKKVKISNFGRFEMHQNPDREYYNLFEKKRMSAKGKRRIQFFFLPKVKKKILANLDMEKILREE